MASLPSPAELARETLKMLASRKLAPTPDNYAQAYQEISGVEQSPAGAVAVIERIAQRLTLEEPQKTALSQSIQQGISSQNWQQCQNALQSLVFQPSEKQTVTNTEPAWSVMIRDLLRQLEVPHKGITLSRKKEGIETVLTRFAKDPSVLHEKLQNLVRSWSSASITSKDETDVSTDTTAGSNLPKAAGTSPATGDSHEFLSQLRELLAHTLESTQHSQPELGSELQVLAKQVRTAENTRQLNELANQLRKFWLKLELRGGDKIRIQEGLLRLLRLLVENVSEFVADDQWLHGQISILKDMI